MKRMREQIYVIAEDNDYVPLIASHLRLYTELEGN